MADGLFPPSGRHPYYVVAPPYVRTSAGIKALHLLGHALTMKGQNAFMASSGTCPDFATPALTDEVVDYHFEKGITPIVVYSEIIEGNPYAAPVVVRYIMNFPGLLGGDKRYPSSELCYGYSANLVKDQKLEDRGNVLFIPASDTNVFHPPKEPKERKGACFYAGKYRGFHGGKLLPITEGAQEIHRELPMAQSPSEIAEIFRSSEVFYCYENSALSLEAALCGCPVVLLPNKYFKEMIALDELGRDGMAWGQSPAEVQRARDTVDRVYSNYQSLVQQFLSDLDRFIELTQKRAAQAAYRKEIDRVRLAFDSAQSRGAVPSAKAIPRSLFKQTFIAVSVAAILISEVGITGFVKKIFKAIRQGGIATLRNRARGIYNRT